MKILALLTSNVQGGDGHIDQQSLFPTLMQEPLSKALGEPVETIARPVWPNASLPSVVDGWMARYEPDLVMLAISPFWFLYESLPIGLERKFGRPGQILSRASLAVAATPWLAHNGVFQGLRRHLQRRIGGSTYFEPDEVIKTAEATIRAVLRREGAYLVVISPAGGDAWATDKASASRIVARRTQVHDALLAFCRSVHVEYWDSDFIAKLADPRPASLQGDELHLDAEGHRRTAEYYLQASVEMCQRAQAHTRSQGEAASRSVSAG